ncbi:neuron navigator [Homalodisca vitripennis]|nr:neuron navigator [Homalodisca vitripennis]
MSLTSLQLLVQVSDTSDFRINAWTGAKTAQGPPSHCTRAVKKWWRKNYYQLVQSALGNTKRTSSSSGFSSARSERSDSSTSLYNDIKSSVPEKKDLGQNDLSLKPGLRKKVIKVSGDSKVTRVPNKPSMTKLVQPVVRTVSEIQPAIPETQDDNSQEAEDKMKAPEPPKSSPTGGSGIPKPMAAVKGTAKPTHSVAPMPQITADKENPEVNHVKQQSVGEEEENTETVKPMQPLLRGYKSNIALTPRPLPVDHSGWRTVTQSPADRGPGDGDYVTTYSSSGSNYAGAQFAKAKKKIEAEFGALLAVIQVCTGNVSTY